MFYAATFLKTNVEKKTVDSNTDKKVNGYLFALIRRDPLCKPKSGIWTAGATRNYSGLVFDLTLRQELN